MDSINSIKSAQLNGSANQYEIPATMRKDGSWRKARRVKPGFVPQEEVPLYTPKGKRVAQTSQYPPGWHPTVATTSAKTKPEKPKQITIEKPKEKPAEIKDKKNVPEKIDVKDVTEKIQSISLSSEALNDPTIEISKKLKRLRRRLRESDALNDKIVSGEITSPEKDQLEKIARRKEFEKEIEQLEEERLKLRQLKPMKNT
ncbi:CLUMA_CG017525, isoform A [Clunio marinus]|uniref:Partner of Y14 and mago n=1 Tax=Clunio marinus TaxID=568069 RepID=A0A1J1IWF9_9DIPT|nr:CLUMA_CG017525, isoform A [Clunio marinus]